MILIDLANQSLFGSNERFLKPSEGGKRLF